MGIRLKPLRLTTEYSLEKEMETTRIIGSMNTSDISMKNMWMNTMWGLNDFFFVFAAMFF